MAEEKQATLHPHLKMNLVRELIRLIPIIGVGFLLLNDGTGSIKLVAFSIGILLAFAATTHLIRKILFPYLDLKLYVDKALETPQSAGMIFLGMSFIFGMMIYAAVTIMK